jgi:hypothetical protein
MVADPAARVDRELARGSKGAIVAGTRSVEAKVRALSHLRLAPYAADGAITRLPVRCSPEGPTDPGMRTNCRRSAA